MEWPYPYSKGTISEVLKKERGWKQIYTKQLLNQQTILGAVVQ